MATAELPSKARQLLEAVGPVAVSAGDLARELADVEVLVVRGEQIDAGLLRAAGSLRVLARTGSGFDNVDVAVASQLGIPVIYAPDAGTAPVAEGTWALIFAAAKRIGELQACLVADRWQQRYTIEGLDLRGGVLGVVGLGMIGREVARIGLALGMQVQACDPLLEEDVDAGGDVSLVDLRTLVARSDVVTLHCALTDATRGMIDRSLLRLAQRRPVLVNAARGAVIDGDELLLEALDNGWLSGVGLDVFASEPIDPDSALLRDPRVICTPHSIGLTRDWNERVFSALVNDINRVLAGDQPKHVVNPEVLSGVASR